MQVRRRTGGAGLTAGAPVQAGALRVSFSRHCGPRRRFCQPEKQCAQCCCL